MNEHTGHPELQKVYGVPLHRYLAWDITRYRVSHGYIGSHMAHFAWVKNTQPWTPGKIMPQILWDKGMADHCAAKGNLAVVVAYPMTEEDETLTLNQLSEKYPAPATA